MLAPSVTSKTSAIAGCSSRQRTCAETTWRSRASGSWPCLGPYVVDERHQHGLHLQVVLVRRVRQQPGRLHQRSPPLAGAGPEARVRPFSGAAHHGTRARRASNGRMSGHTPRVGVTTSRGSRPPRHELRPIGDQSSSRRMDRCAAHARRSKGGEGAPRRPGSSSMPAVAERARREYRRGSTAVDRPEPGSDRGAATCRASIRGRRRRSTTLAAGACRHPLGRHGRDRVGLPVEGGSDDGCACGVQHRSVSAGRRVVDVKPVRERPASGARSCAAHEPPRSATPSSIRQALRRAGADAARGSHPSVNFRYLTGWRPAGNA